MLIKNRVVCYLGKLNVINLTAQVLQTVPVTGEDNETISNHEVKLTPAN